MKTVLLPKPTTRVTYKQVDFKAAYEKLFEDNQKLQIRFQAAMDEINHLKKRVVKLEADNTYLRKLLFSQKSERGKKKRMTRPITHLMI